MNSNQPLISIIIPIYKVEKYLPQCLDSCINQTYTNIEILAVNDGSPDNCGDIIDSYVAKDNRIIHLRKENAGISLARETGTLAAKGDYVLYIDGDDFVTNDAIAKVVEKALKTDADFTYSNFYYYYGSEEKDEYEMNPKNINIRTGIEFLESGIPTFMWMKLIKREIIGEIKIQNVNVSEDYFFMLQVLPKCKKITCVKEPLYHYRQHSASIMNSNISFIVEGWLSHAVQRIKLAENLPLTQKINDHILFDNVHIIYRYLKFGDKKEKSTCVNDLKTLTNITLKRYPVSRLRTIHNFNLLLFLVVAKYFPNLLKKILR